MKGWLLEFAVLGVALPLVFSAAPAGATTNLLTNGSFETGDFTGWTVLNTNPPPNNAAVVANADLILPEDGQFEAAFVGLAGLQIGQAFADTAGDKLEVSVWYAVTDPSADLEVIIAGVEHNIPIVDTGLYREFRFAFAATGSDTLQISSIAQAEFVNLVDNLSILPFVGVSETPEASTWAMMIAGFVGLAVAGRRRGMWGGLSKSA